MQSSHQGYDVELPMLLPDINDDGVVVARGIAVVVNRSEDDHYEALAVVLNVLHLLIDVPCVELWDILKEGRVWIGVLEWLDVIHYQ